ncbi:MAG: hypothetical protein IKN53_02595, partial [Oscillibacter sp.]|nr:hypothetical protein [Oscillibacter sp.]
MFGIILKTQEKRALRPIAVTRGEILRAPFLCAEVARNGSRFRERRRLSAAARKLAHFGAEAIVSPAPLPKGICAVGTAALRREIAAGWAEELLRGDTEG